MSLLKCPKCGELFSDSYRECPFCLEDEEFHSGRKPKNPGRRVQKQKAPSILGPAMVVVALLLVGFLGYAFLGDNFSDWMDELKKPPVENPVDDPAGDDPVVDDPVVPVDITLDKTTLELKAGEAAALSAAGAEGISWSSSDEAVAKVDESGKVTAVAAGSATITASAENANSAACVVTVTAAPVNRDLAIASQYGYVGGATIKKGESVRMKVIDQDTDEEVTEGVSWSVKDESVLSVDSEGNITGKKSGDYTTLYAEVDGKTLTARIDVN